MKYSEADLALVRELLARELKTINEYTALLDRASNPAVRQLLEKIVIEEKEHIAEAVAVLGQNLTSKAAPNPGPITAARPAAARPTSTQPVEYQPANRQVAVAPEQTLLAAAIAAKIPLRHDCGGRGACGTCRVEVLRGGQNLTSITDPEKYHLEDLLRQGWRLACQVRPTGPLAVRVPPIEKKG